MPVDTLVISRGQGADQSLQRVTTAKKLETEVRSVGLSMRRGASRSGGGGSGSDATSHETRNSHGKAKTKAILEGWQEQRQGQRQVGKMMERGQHDKLTWSWVNPTDGSEMPKTRCMPTIALCLGSFENLSSFKNSQCRDHCISWSQKDGSILRGAILGVAARVTKSRLLQEGEGYPGGFYLRKAVPETAP